MNYFKSLREAYEIGESYYGIEVNVNHLFLDRCAKNHCQSFIEDHFFSGGKEKALDIPFLEMYNQSGKHIHTVSLYLLGCAMEEVFSSEIKQSVKKALNSECKWYEKNDFFYSWFLTCLYHDVASCIETTIPFNASESFKHLEFYLGKWNIRYTPFNHQPIKRTAALNCFSEELIKNYFYYMATKGEIDHGIIGGYLFFDKIKKNYITNTQRKRDREEKGFLTIGKKGREIKWSIEHLDHFAYVADAIICHNLWTRNDGDRSEEYEEFGLDPLIIKSDSDRVDFSEFPLQFMLRLLDSLEPTKRFEELPPYAVLKNVYVSPKEGKGVKIGWRRCLENETGFERWFNTIKGLNKWMKVSVSDVEDNRSCCFVTINFKVD